MKLTRAFLVGALAIAMFPTSSTAASITETTLTKSASVVRGPFSSTNGTNFAVAWAERLPDDKSKVVVAIKEGNGAWSAATKLGQLEWSWWTDPKSAVMGNGTVVVAWVDDENIVVRQHPTGGAWSAPVVLPGSTFDGIWRGNLDITNSGTAVTVTAYHIMAGEASLMSWTRSTVDGEWTSATISDIPMSAELGSCTASTLDDCNYGWGDIDIESNANGYQVVSWSMSRTLTPSGALPGARFAMYESHRESPTAQWSTTKLVDSMKGTTRDAGASAGYAYFTNGITITPAGKVALTLYRGLLSAGYDARIYVKAANADTFVQSDSTTLTAGYATADPIVGAIGETMWAKWDYQPTTGSGYIAKIGVVGSLNKGKTLGLETNYDVNAIFNKDGAFALLLSPEADYNAKGTFTSIRNSAGTWGAAEKRTLQMPAWYYGRRSTWDLVTTSSKQLFTYSIQKGICPANCSRTGIYATFFS